MPGWYIHMDVARKALASRFRVTRWWEATQSSSPDAESRQVGGPVNTPGGDHLETFVVKRLFHDHH